MRWAVFLILATLGAVLCFWYFRAKVRLELYDVQDLVSGVGDLGRCHGDSPEDELAEGVIGGYQFAKLLKLAVRPGHWDENSRWTVDCRNGMLIVRAPSHVQQEVAAYLRIVRAGERGSHPARADGAVRKTQPSVGRQSN
jgi:hypothetical protein